MEGATERITAILAIAALFVRWSIIVPAICSIWIHARALELAIGILAGIYLALSISFRLIERLHKPKVQAN